MLTRRIEMRPRRSASREVRADAAQLAADRPHADHRNNGEEEAYRNHEGKLSYIANYSKALLHNQFGEVIPDAYRTMVRGMYSGDVVHFERVDMMGTLDGLNLTNPQAGLAFDLQGADAQAVTIPPAPRIDGAEVAAEMAELYWMALCRDVDFRDYGTGLRTDLRPGGGSYTNDAVASLSAFSAVASGAVVGIPAGLTVNTLFRGFTAGDLVGPYISQFLLKGTADPVLNPVPDKGIIKYGTLAIHQRQKTARPARNNRPGATNAADTLAPQQDYLITFADWLAVQDGEDRRDTDNFDPTRRFMRNLRDLATYVHFDALYEAYLNACLLLLNMPARLDPGNPYIDMPAMHVAQRTQDGFATFGAPHILSLVTEVATRALKAVWYQKWGVHRRLRPEEFGGRVQVELHGTTGLLNSGQGRYTDIIPNELLTASVLNDVQADFNSKLLPQAFPEGAPTHPAYGAGHATVAGACVTILKAWFDESEVFDPSVIPNAPSGSPPNVIARVARLRENRRPKVPNRANASPSGTILEDYPTAGVRKLTVGGELNKLAANISLGRNAAGVHWRSDYTQSLRLGEEIAIKLLQEQKLTYNEDHHFSLTTFDGRSITI